MLYLFSWNDLPRNRTPNNFNFNFKSCQVQIELTAAACPLLPAEKIPDLCNTTPHHTQDHNVWNRANDLCGSAGAPAGPANQANQDGQRSGPWSAKAREPDVGHVTQANGSQEARAQPGGSDSTPNRAGGVARGAAGRKAGPRAATQTAV